MPPGFHLHTIDPAVSVRVTGAMAPLDPARDARVEALWQAAIARVAAGGAGTLFNGRVFSADRITPTVITGHMTEFRRVVAQMDDPGLALGVRPLAVCGVLRGADGVVIGRRPDAAVYQPGLWQLPPAGSVDHQAVRPDGTIDLVAQILAEAREELGLEPDQIDAAKPLCAVEHPGSRVTDLGILLSTSLTMAEVLAVHANRGNAEYHVLRALPFAEIAAFVREAGEDLVPPAIAFLRQAGLLPYGVSPPFGP
jgi:hypothetical protein